MSIITFIDIELFTLKDKYTLIIFAIILLTINIFIFLELKSLKYAKKYQLKTKKQKYLYILSIAIIVISSLFFTIPYLEQKTMITQDTLCEGLIDEEIHYIKLVNIENTYYPTYNKSDSVISWYTRDARNPKYLESVNVSVYKKEGSPILYIDENLTILAIVKATKPKENRGIETQSYWYSFIFIIYNLLIAIFAYPMFLAYKRQIKMMWKTQNIVSSILLAIIISQTFMF